MQHDTGINEMWASLLSTYCVPGGASQKGVWWDPAWVETVGVEPGRLQGRLPRAETGWEGAWPVPDEPGDQVAEGRACGWSRCGHPPPSTPPPPTPAPLTCFTLPLKYLGGIKVKMW